MFFGTEEEARAEFEAMISPDSTPALSSDDIDRLLAGAKRADRYGLAPTDDDWAGTWDLNWAAARSCRWRMNRSANTNQYMQDARGQASDYTFLNWQREAEHYESLITSSVPLAGRRRRVGLESYR